MTAPADPPAANRQEPDTLRCDGSCGYTTSDHDLHARCPNCDFGLLVRNEDEDV